MLNWRYAASGRTCRGSIGGRESDSGVGVGAVGGRVSPVRVDRSSLRSNQLKSKACFVIKSTLTI